MRIHEFAKEIDRSSNEVLACLKDLGVEKKTASSSIEDDLKEQVKDRLLNGKKTAEAPAPQEQPEERKQPKPEQKPEKPETPSGKGNAAPEKTAQPKEKQAGKDRPASQAKPASQPAAQPPKKKKPNIIFVSNPHNSQARGRSDFNQGRGGNRPGQGMGRNQSNSGRPNTSQLIKPNVPRSQTQLVYQEPRPPIRPD
nr:translation initiation factor IF-2 N-terminal domain-containing protein [Lachnospiraceae bacterium]